MKVEHTKRIQIIEAAYQIMAEKGYEKASIKDIAKAAHITPGLVHYYFKNKEEILVELLSSLSRKYSEEMLKLQAVAPIERLADLALDEPKHRVHHQPEWYKIRYELFALGLRDASLTEKVDDLLENARVGIQHILQRIFPQRIDESRSLAAIMLACFDGLALQRLINPSFNLDQSYELLAKMVKAYMNRPH